MSVSLPGNDVLGCKVLFVWFVGVGWCEGIFDGSTEDSLIKMSVKK